MRLPVLAVGMGLLAKCAIDLYGMIIHKAPISQEGMRMLLYGSGLLELASSMYLKDIDQSLLKRDLLWKRAYEGAKKIASELFPSPLPLPAPMGYEAHD